jgi:hypothetical protein
VMRLIVAAAMLVVLAACGGDGDGGESDAGGSSGTSAAQNNGGSDAGNVVNPQPSGQAEVVLPDETYTVAGVGAAGCTVDGSEFEMSFVTADNSLGLIFGGDTSASRYSINFTILSGGRQTLYTVNTVRGDSGSVAVDGDSASYSGPMFLELEGGERTLVGDVTVSATCE